MKSISISIVIYQPDKKVIISVLNSLNDAIEQLLNKEQYKVQLVILDNSVARGKYDTEKIVQKNWSKPLQLINSAANIGFGKGHNQAILHCQGYYHLILNPDVILAPNALVIALEYLQQHPEAVLVSPYACSEDGNKQYLCKSYPSVLDLFLRGFAPKWCKQYFANRLDRYELKGQAENIELDSVPIVSGCFMLLHRRDFDKVGGFSEQFFLYFEDFDLSIKLRELGNLAYVPEVKIIHFGGQAAKKGIRHIALFFHSMCLFFNKHGWRWY